MEHGTDFTGSSRKPWRPDGPSDDLRENGLSRLLAAQEAILHLRVSLEDFHLTTDHLHTASFWKESIGQGRREINRR
jgi:hypothetical protein